MKLRHIIAQFLMALLGSAATAVAQDTNAQRILESAMSSMTKPMRYTVSAGWGQGFAITQMVDEQKQLLTRIQVDFGKHQMLYLFNPSGSFQLFPKTKTAIAFDSLPEGAPIAKLSLFESILPSTAILKVDRKGDDKRPYQLSVDLIAPDAGQSTNKANWPDRYEYLIARGSYLVTEFITYRGTTRMSSLKLHDHAPITSPSLEEFLVPASYSIKRPDSLLQFAGFIGGQLALANPPKRIPKGFALDPDTGKMVRVGPRELPSQDELDKLLEETSTRGPWVIRTVFFGAVGLCTLILFRRRLTNLLTGKNV